jgi:hypothetical protein
MKTFRDTAGREWAITIDVSAIKRVMKLTFDYMGEPLKVNLLALVEPNSDLLKKIVEYPPLVCDIAYALCKPQCDEKNVSDEEFGRAMGGDVLERALDLILEEIVDFFPESRRAILRKVLEKGRAFDQKVKSLWATRLAMGELDQIIDQVLQAELKKLEAPLSNGTGSAGSLPALSASIPVPEPSPS